MSYPLEGIRVIELGQIIAGTYGGQVLSDLGAEVIKVETPNGDLGRIPSVAPINGESGLFLTFNRNKKSMVIDLKTEKGLKIFYNLIKKADVVVDNFRPGVLDRLKINYETLKKINKRIIQCSVTGYGETGEYANLPALDIIIQSISGYMAITGEPDTPPVRTGIPLADLSGGIFSCKAILAALYKREKTGKGSSISLSMFDGMLSLLTYLGTVWLTKGELPIPPGSSHMYSVPWQAFKVNDGYVVIATRQEVFWERMCDAMNLEYLKTHEKYATNPKRVENRDELIPILEKVFITKSVKEWIDLFREYEVPCAPVNNLDGAFNEPPVLERDMVVKYQHPTAGEIKLPGNPMKFADVEGTISNPAPTLGQHTTEILSSLLEMDKNEIKKLINENIIK
jgi:crotonobetainyl-CoA:carnitine CoA-transferase CaiB-like acyl-CoA transferase